MGDVNLISAPRLERRRRKVKKRMWTVICGIYFILLTVLALSAHTLWRDTDDYTIEELAFATARVTEYNTTISELQGKLKKAEAELKADKLISREPDWARLLVLVGDELKEEIVLDNCQLATFNKNLQDTKNNLQELLSSSSPSIFLAERQYKLELSGYGRTQTSVVQFALRLEQMQMFDKVELITSRRQAFLNSEAVAFTIECKI